MDWDEEELSTQIYDKPDAVAAMAPGAAPPPPGPAPLPPVSSPLGAPPPMSTPLAPPPAPPPSLGRPPSQPAPMPPPATAPGVPSPFDFPANAATPSPVAHREPTAVTARPGDAKKKSSLMPLVAVAAVILLGVAAVGGYFAFGGKRPGTITLTTTPADPVVLFDTRPVQATSSPFVIADVTPGEMHLIEVSKTGYQTWSQQVRVQPGQELNVGPVVLTPVGGAPVVATGSGTPAPTPAPGGAAGAAPGTVPAVGAAGAAPAGGAGFSLESSPPGAKVLVDGRELPQRTPVTVTDLAPGVHTVRVEAGSQYLPFTTQITLAPGQVMQLPRAVLELRAVAVTFRSSPEGARVTLVRGAERRQLGTTPTTAEVELSGAPWTVELTRDGHETFTQALTLPAGEPAYTFEGTLTPRRVAAAGGGGPRVGGGGGGARGTGGGGGATTAVGGSSAGAGGAAAGGGAGGGGAAAGGGAGGGMGTLRINTRPWSQVYVDGQLIGNTPQMNIQLRAGQHRVTLVNSDFNIRETITVNIVAGQTETKILTLNPG
jgi:hypothetical protein